LLVRGLDINFGLDLRGSGEASIPRKGSDSSCSIVIIDLIKKCQWLKVCRKRSAVTLTRIVVEGVVHIPPVKRG